MRMNFLTKSWARGNERKRILFSQELDKKEAVLSLCLVKRKLLKEYDTYKLNKYNIIIMFSVM